MALYRALVPLDDGQGVRRIPPAEFEVSVDGGGVPLEADDRANLAAGRMELVSAGPGPDPLPDYRNVELEVVGGKLVRGDTRAEILDPNSVEKTADLGTSGHAADHDAVAAELILKLGTGIFNAPTPPSPADRYEPRWDQANGRLTWRSSQMFRVRDYGAVGNGTADDTAAIQACIDACVAAKGGIIFVDRGAYSAGGLVVDGDDITIMGVGFDSKYGQRGSRITLKSGANTSLFRVPYGRVNVDFERLHLEGRKADQTDTSCGIYYEEDPAAANVVYSTSVVKRCWIKNFKTAGVWAGKWQLAIDVINCIISDNAGHGIALESSDGCVTQCHILANGGDGVRVGGSNCMVYGNSSISGNLRGVAVESGGSGNPVKFTTGSDIFGHQIYGNHIDTSKRENVVIQGLACSVLGNVINGASQETHNTYASVRIDPQLSDGTLVYEPGHIVADNQFRNLTSFTKKPTFHVLVGNYSGTVTKIAVSNNYFEPGGWAQSTPINDWQILFNGTVGNIEGSRLILTNPTSTNPTIVGGAALGTGAPTPTLSSSRGSNDSKGQINVGTGTSPTTGDILTVTFTKPYRTIPVLNLTPCTAGAATLRLWYTATVNGFTVSLADAPAAGQSVGTYSWGYEVVG